MWPWSVVLYLRMPSGRREIALLSVLGVIDRAEQMHSILDVETSATLAWLDGWIQDRGGRFTRPRQRGARSV